MNSLRIIYVNTINPRRNIHRDLSNVIIPEPKFVRTPFPINQSETKRKTKKRC
jgi:hypothetical protein